LEGKRFLIWRKKMTVADQIFADLDRAIEEAFEVRVDSLPVAFRTAKRKTRTLGAIANQARRRRKVKKDPATVPCKFVKVDGKRTMSKATYARRDIIENYASQVVDGGEITFQQGNEAAIFAKEVEFAAMLVKEGIVPLSYFEW
jgi:hypothetical protein